MKRIGWIVLVLVMMIVGTACGKSESTGAGSNSSSDIVLADITATFTGEADVVSTGEFHTYTVTLKDASGNPVSVDKVYLFMNMEGMHHPTEGTMHEGEKGVYTLDLPLAMEGEWYAEVTLTVGEQQRLLDRFVQKAEGKKYMMYMKGYNADTGSTADMNGEGSMDHGSDGGHMDQDSEEGHDGHDSMNSNTGNGDGKK